MCGKFYANKSIALIKSFGWFFVFVIFVFPSVYAQPCQLYGAITNVVASQCGCLRVVPGDTNDQSYAAFSIADGISTQYFFATRCIGPSDSVCNGTDSLPSNGASGTYYFRNTTVLNDYFKCDWVMGFGFAMGSASAHQPTPSLSELIFMDEFEE